MGRACLVWPQAQPPSLPLHISSCYRSELMFCGRFYGQMCLAISPNLGLAAVVSTVAYANWLLFAGYLYPQPVRPLHVLSPHMQSLDTARPL